MPVDKAMIASAREANAAYLASYEQRLAGEIVAMLPEAPDEALRVLAGRPRLSELDAETAASRRRIGGPELPAGGRFERRRPKARAWRGVPACIRRGRPSHGFPASVLAACGPKVLPRQCAGCILSFAP